MTRKEEIQRLRSEGNSYQKIGRIFKVSRQRIHQILTGYRSPAQFGEHMKERRRILNRQWRDRQRAMKKLQEKAEVSAN